MAEIERIVKHCEVDSLPLNFGNKIDEGSSATIYFHTLQKKPAAVKVFKGIIAKKSLLQICAKLRQLKNDNIVRFRGYSIRPSAIFFEYCSVTVGEEIVHNLSQLMAVLNNLGEFFLHERLDFISQGLHGLNYLHQQNIIHRDFKPANLLIVGERGKICVKITDFDELFKVKNTITSTKTTNTLRGMTLPYTSPELCLLTVNSPTVQSDMYSFAITFFEVLCDFSSAWIGVLPILNDTILVNALVQGKRPLIDKIQQIYTDEQCDVICNIIVQCWDEDYTKRPETSEVRVN